MITQAELTLLRDATSKAVLPGIDTVTGNASNAAKLIQTASISTQHSAPFSYNAATNTVTVTQNGAVLSGYNFGTAEVMIEANNVTIKNSTFNGTTGWYSVDQVGGYSGATIENDTFKGGSATNTLKLGAFIGAQNNITVKDDSFLNAPGDAVDIRGGTVSGNYFQGGGYSSLGEHPDAIWVTDTNCPTMISDNFIDWTWASPQSASVNGVTTGVGTGSNGVTNDCVRITTEQGSVSNVTVDGNYLIGGSSVIDAGNAGTQGTFSNINITNNMIGFGTYYDVMQGPNSGVAMSGNTYFDWKDSAYSSDAWSAYQAAGIHTANLVVASSAGTNISAPSKGSTTLYGAGAVEHLYGGANENIFVGGFGTQYIWGGSGQNVVTYLSISDSTATGGEDLIGNFHTSQDVIDLSHIDANLGQAGLQNFTFLGAAPLTAAGGQVDYVQNAALKETFVQVSLAGDAQPDMVIRLNGLLTLTAANFDLTEAQSAASTSLPAIHVGSHV